MNIYIARDQNNVPLWLYDEELDTVYPFDAVSNRDPHPSVQSHPPAPMVEKHPKKTKAAKPAKNLTGKKYVKGTCGQCGKPGHSKWHCPDRKDKPAKVRKPGSARKGYKCKNCGVFGHQSKTCPDLKPTSGFKDQDESSAEKKECLVCHSIEHNTKECPDLGDKIGELQEAGKDSLRIASALRISLKVVNEHWDAMMVQKD